MNSAFTLGLLQTDIYWENPSRQLAALETLLPAAGQVDLLLLPECFATGFSMNPHLVSHAPEILDWMKHQAQNLQTAIAGTLFSRSATGQLVNRFWMVLPDGRWFRYDKKHVFSYAGENLHFSPGKKQVIIEYKGVRIAPMVCYDLRFPLWSRRHPGFDYDLLLYPANWPERRKMAWKTLLPARAIENQAFVAGVNRVGTDGKGINHAGDSGAWDFLGEALAFANNAESQLVIARLDIQALQNFRTDFPFADDADAFSLL